MIPGDIGDILPATTVKRRFLELLKSLRDQRAVITVTRNGVPAGVLMSVEEYESLVETLEILADPKIARAMTRASQNLLRGNTLSHDEVWHGE